MNRIALTSMLAIGLTLSAGSVASAGQPNQSCEDQPTRPGQSASAPGSAFNPDGVGRPFQREITAGAPVSLCFAMSASMSADVTPGTSPNSTTAASISDATARSPACSELA